MAVNPEEYYGSGLNITEAVAKACKELTLVDALSWIAVWETERVVRQAKKYFETGVSTASHGGGWDTCFKVCFEEVLKKYPGGYVPQPCVVPLPQKSPEEHQKDIEVEAAMWEAIADGSRRKAERARKRNGSK